MPAMQPKGSIIGRDLPAMDEFEANAFLDDFAVSDDPDKPITAGVFRLEAGQSMTYTYEYHEMKLVIDGQFNIADDTGQTRRAIALRTGRLPERQTAARLGAGIPGGAGLRS